MTDAKAGQKPVPTCGAKVEQEREQVLSRRRRQDGRKRKAEKKQGRRAAEGSPEKATHEGISRNV